MACGRLDEEVHFLPPPRLVPQRPLPHPDNRALARPQLAALIGDPVARQAFEVAAAGSGRSFAVANTSRSLLNLISRWETRAVVLELCSDERIGRARLVHLVHSRHPFLPILVLVRLTADEVSCAISLARCHSSEVVIFVEGYAQLANRLRMALKQSDRPSVAHRALADLNEELPARTSDVIRYSVANADRRIGVDDVAAGFGESRWTLVRRLAAEGELRPHRAIVWGQLLYAADLATLTRTSIELLATHSGFADGPTLQHSLRTYAKLKATDLFTSEGRAALRQALVVECRALASHYRRTSTGTEVEAMKVSLSEPDARRIRSERPATT